MVLLADFKVEAHHRLPVLRRAAIADSAVCRAPEVIIASSRHPGSCHQLPIESRSTLGVSISPWSSTRFLSHPAAAAASFAPTRDLVWYIAHPLRSR